MIVHDHHNGPNDPINRSKRIARIEHPEVEPTAVALDRRIGASLIGFMALIIFGGLIVTLFDMMTDSNTSRTTTGVGHSSPLTSLPKR